MDEFHISTLDNFLSNLNAEFVDKLNDTETDLSSYFTNIQIELINKVFLEVNSSIIAGEYLEDDFLVWDALNSCSDKLDSLLSTLSNRENLDVTFLYTSITFGLNYIRIYQTLNYRIGNIIKVKNEVFLNNDFEYDDIKEKCTILLNNHDSLIDVDGIIKKNLYNYYEILLINAHLLISDFKSNPSEREYNKLNFFEKELSRLKSDRSLIKYLFLEIIYEKAKFLKLKLFLRIFQTQSEMGFELKIFGETDYNSIDELTSTLTISELKKFIIYSKNHYLEDSKNAENIKNYYKGIPLDNNSFQNNHLRIKFFKDVNPIKSNLEEIVKSFKIELDNNNSDSNFNNYAKRISYNYAVNNLFSFYLENEDFTYERAIGEYEKVKKDLFLTEIKNFFPELRFIKFLVQRIESQLSKKYSHNEFLNVSDYIDKCSELLKIYKQNLNWTKFNHDFIFQARFHECIIKRNPNVEKARLRQLFIASTFVLPLNKDVIAEEYASYESKIKLFDGIRNTLRIISYESQKLDQLNSDALNKDVKYIEILGIFCTVSTFASAAILSILSEKSYNQTSANQTSAAEFIIIISISLLSFLGILIFVLKNKYITKNFLVVLFVVLLFLLLGYINR